MLTDVMIKNLLAMPTSTDEEAKARELAYRKLFLKFGIADTNEAIAMEQAITVKQLRELCNDYCDDVKVIVMINKNGAVFSPMVFPMGEYIKPARNIVLRIGDNFLPKL